MNGKNSIDFIDWRNMSNYFWSWNSLLFGFIGNWNSSKPSDQASLDPRILSAEMRLAALRCEYDSLLKKHHEDRERLNNIRSQLRKSYDDLQYLRENESTNSRKWSINTIHLSSMLRNCHNICIAIKKRVQTITVFVISIFVHCSSVNVCHLVVS